MTSSRATARNEDVIALLHHRSSDLRALAGSCPYTGQAVKLDVAYDVTVM